MTETPSKTLIMGEYGNVREKGKWRKLAYLYFSSDNGNEIWANLHFSTPGTKCLLMYTANGGKSWSKVIEYSRATHQVWLINSSNETSDVLYFSIED